MQVPCSQTALCSVFLPIPPMTAPDLQRATSPLSPNLLGGIYPCIYARAAQRPLFLVTFLTFFHLEDGGRSLASSPAFCFLERSCW